MITTRQAYTRNQIPRGGGGEAELRRASMPGSKRVLIVEDNPLSMKLFNDLLEAHGQQTVKAANGIHGYELARTTHPDLILMDIQLPDVSGLEVTRWLKDDLETRHIPVIAMTASGIIGVEQKVLDSGCDAYLPKPINIDAFLRLVEAYLFGRRTPLSGVR